MKSPPRPGPAATRTAARRAERVFALALLLAPAGCASFWLDDADETRLATFKYNSKAYYEIGDYARAEDQCRRGLEILDDDDTLRLTLAYTLLMQSDRRKLEEAATIFEEQIGFFGSDDWRLHQGYGMTLQQLARLLSASEKPEEKTRVAGLRAQARDELDAAAEGSAETRNTPPEVPYHLALLDLEEGRRDLFPVHAKAAVDKLTEQEKFLAVQLKQPMGQSELRRSERDKAINAERGRRITREAARYAWEEQDWKTAEAAMQSLETFGALERPDFYDRARVREQAGNVEGAVQDYEKFLTMSGERVDDTVTRAVESLQRLRSQLAERRTSGQLSSGR